MTSLQRKLAEALEAGLSQEQLAKLAGVSRLTLEQWLLGKAAPHAFVAKYLEVALDLAIDRARERDRRP